MFFFIFADIIGVVKSFSFETVQLRSGKGSFLKQIVNIMDIDKNMVCVQLTGEAVQRYSFEENKVAAFESLVVKEYNGVRYLQFCIKSEYIAKPKQEDIDKLHDSIAEPYAVNILTKHFEEMSIKMANEKFIDAQSTMFISFESEISDVDTSLIYKSCPSSNCAKKVIQDVNGNYICNNCGVFGTFQLNFLLKIGIECDNELFWLTSFGSTSEKMLKKDNLCLSYLYSSKKEEFDECIKQMIGQKLKLGIRISKNNIIEDDIQYIVENVDIIENEFDNGAGNSMKGNEMQNKADENAGDTMTEKKTEDKGETPNDDQESFDQSKEGNSKRRLENISYDDADDVNVVTIRQSKRIRKN